MKAIDTNKCIYKANESAIFVLRFGFAHPIEVAQFCALAQECLCDELGASCYFRMAPKQKQYLTENFIEYAGTEARYNEYYERGSNEIIAAFCIRETDPDVSLNDELDIFPKELALFCNRADATVEQLDIASMY